MKMQGSATQLLETLIEFPERSGIKSQGNRHFDGLAKRKGFKSLLGGKLRMEFAVIVDHAAHIGAQLRQRCVFANVKAGKLLGKFRTVASGQSPLREVVGKSLGEKVMAAKTLERVEKNAGVAARFQPG